MWRSQWGVDSAAVCEVPHQYWLVGHRFIPIQFATVGALFCSLSVLSFSHTVRVPNPLPLCMSVSQVLFGLPDPSCTFHYTMCKQTLPSSGMAKPLKLPLTCKFKKLVGTAVYLYLYTIFDQHRLDIIDQVEHGRSPQQVTHVPPVWA